MKLYLIFLSLLLFFLLGCTTALTDPNPVPPLDEEKASPLQTETTCNDNTECVLVDGDICGCTAGGTAKTINKQYMGAWISQLQKDRENMGCPAVMSQHISCFSEPKCVNNQCVLVPIKDQICDTYLYTNCVQAPQTRNCEEILKLCE